MLQYDFVPNSYLKCHSYSSVSAYAFRTTFIWSGTGIGGWFTNIKIVVPVKMSGNQWPVSICIGLFGYGTFIIKIRRSWDRLIIHCKRLGYFCTGVIVSLAAWVLSPTHISNKQQLYIYIYIYQWWSRSVENISKRHNIMSLSSLLRLHRAHEHPNRYHHSNIIKWSSAAQDVVIVRW